MRAQGASLASPEGMKLKIKSTRERLLASTMIVGALALAGAGQAMAQATPPVTTAPPGTSGAPAFGSGTAIAPEVSANGQPQTVQEVTVTGSRIPQPNLAATSPVTAVGAQELKYEGTTDAIQALDQLPQTSGDLGNTPNPLGSGEGITTVNLRGLGSSRTLVLQDGKRLMPGDPTSGGAADIDQIPSQLIDRIDVVTGGASAVYGSDAIGGVVNFVMKHNFQGLQFDIQGGFDQSGNSNQALAPLAAAAGGAAAGINIPNGSVTDGTNFIASLLFGANTSDGKGNVEGFVSYRHQDPISEGARSYSACALAATNAGVPSCAGSANSNLFFDGNSGNEYSVQGNQFVPYGTATTASPPTAFNSNPYEYLQRGDERYQAGFFAHYQVLPQAEIYNDFQMMDDRSQENIAPSGSFLGSVVTPGNTDGLIDIPCNDPLLSAQELASLTCVPQTVNGQTVSAAEIELGRRNIEGGARTDDYEHLSFRDVLGVRGDLTDAWHYDGYAQYGYTRYNNEVGGYLSNSRIASALYVVPGANGPQCGYTIPGVGTPCVPYNIFTQGGVSQAALNYLTVNAEEQGFTQEQVAHFDITGQLGKYGIQSPFADRGVGVNLGAEYRREELVLDPDQTFQNNDLGGGSGATLPVSGSFDVYELFGELVVPIVTDRPFAHDLSFDGGYRYSNYSSVGQVESYKLSLEYAPVRDLRFRGSFQRAVRAPNVTELFSAASVTNTSAYADPCAAVNAPNNMAPGTLQECLNTGGNAASFGNGIAKGQTVNGVAGTNTLLSCPADQCSAQIGGNTGLKAETSDTVSYGGVFTPRWLPNFDFSVDYYDIDVKGAVSTVPLGTAVAECETTANPTYCDLIHRGANGGLYGTGTGAGYVTGTLVNIGFFKTTGIDFEGNYRFNLAQLGYGDLGRLAFNFDGTYVQHFISEPLPGLGSYDCAGYYGETCGWNPRFRSKFRVTYSSPYRFTVSAQWRYDGAQRLDQNQPNPLLQYTTNGGFNNFDASVGSTSYLDLSATYKLNDMLAFRAGVNNVLDQNPPLLTYATTGSGSPNTFSEYDLVGRSFYFGLTADF
jgi:iron complex outermembrane receptor protein